MERNNSSLKAKNAKEPSRPHWQATPALASLFLGMALTLSGCTQIKYVQVPPAKIPSELTDDTIPSAMPDPFTFGASLVWNEQLLTSIGQCNLDKAGIRKIEAERQK